ncbi:flagellar filament capping protein FliD [Gracilibacillus sp. HCP3S3_G5_1]|uniref:flagellar filament capping protein FliD n=1 Tax=unclassified Gracilibacillus TaxID=2625209 RepID=UPI003F8B1BDC
MRISGFASGMDIDQMVKDLMRAESMPLQRMEQQKQILEWKRDDYRSINTLLLDFRNTLTDMRLTTSYRARQTSTTNEELVSATANGSASQSSFELSSVTQLAKSASWLNNGKISGGELNASKSMQSQSALEVEWKQGAIFKEDITVESNNQTISLERNNIDSDAVTIKVNGKGYEVITSGEPGENQVLLENGQLTFADGAIKANDKITAEYVTDGINTDSRELTADTKTFQLSGRSIENLALTIDGNTYSIGTATGNEGEYQLVDSNQNSIGVINKNTGLITFNGEIEEGTTIEANYQQNYTAFSVGAQTSKGETYENFIIRGNESLNQVVSRVNNADLGVSMMYDSFTDQVSLRRTETGQFGEEGTQDISVGGAFMTDTLGFNNPNNYQAGQNAEFTINGLTTQRTTNNFQIDGVTFNLKQTFTEADGPVTVNVTNDTDAVFDNIKEFVETYNALIDAINGKAQEQYYRDYDPLTDDQRESLSEKQQEEWEEMAKSGLLRNDPILQSALSSMRGDFYSPVNNADSAGTFNQLAAIGITTTSNYLDGGKLEINETKLREAIEADPAAVENLFRGDGDTYEEQGIVRRLTDSVNNTMDRIYERAGRATYTNQQFTLGRNLEQVEKQIERFQDRLKQIEDRYWRQFTAMEKAMQHANQQAMFLQQQFGGMMY